MCGICGFVNIRDEYIKKLLCYANETRGRQTSSCIYEKSNEFHISKITESISKTISDGLFDESVWKSKIMLFHNRQASNSLGVNGGNKIENAHPFVCENIIGAHNGYWSNYEELSKKYNIPKNQSVVDSNVAIYLINMLGIKALPELLGSGSMWWIDKRIQDVFFLWNWKKELAISSFEDKFIFSSDINHLKLVVCKNWNTTNLDTNVGQLLKISTKTGELISREDVRGAEVKVEIYSGKSYDNDWNDNCWFGDGWEYYNRSEWSEKNRKKGDKLDSCYITSCPCEANSESSQQDIYEECKFIICSSYNLYRCDTCNMYLHRTEIMRGGHIHNSCAKCHSSVNFVRMDEKIISLASRIALLDETHEELVYECASRRFNFNDNNQLRECVELAKDDIKNVAQSNFGDVEI